MSISPILRELQSICHSLEKANKLRSVDVSDHHGLRSAYRQLVLSSLTVIRERCADIERTLQMEKEDLAAAAGGHSVDDPFDTNPY